MAVLKTNDQFIYCELAQKLNEEAAQEIKIIILYQKDKNSLAGSINSLLELNVLNKVHKR